MSDKSTIEWTDATWNPVTGCTKVSPACANCYIERTPPFRVRGRKFVNGNIPLEFHENRLDAPLRRTRPTTYFVNSLSDLFHEDVPDAFIDKVFAVMALVPQHTFQVLTKRPERMRGYLRAASETWGERRGGIELSMYELGNECLALSIPESEWPLKNVWLGVSVENQRLADERIPLLLQTPSAVRFISAEPLLGPVDLNAIQIPDLAKGLRFSALTQAHDDRYGSSDTLLDWVIVGGESGPRLRLTDSDWVRSMRDQCRSAGVPFFFKQWGGRTSKSGGRELDGRTWDEMPGT